MHVSYRVSSVSEVTCGMLHVSFDKLTTRHLFSNSFVVVVCLLLT